MATDFITIFGRLLHDGRLRDDFASEPAIFSRQFGLDEADQDALMRLSPADLEFQASILLRKRFEQIMNFMPHTTSLMGDGAWPMFLTYGRATLLKGTPGALDDAARYCRHCANTFPGSVSQGELNRLNFAVENRRLAVHLVRDLQLRGRGRSGFQIFVRTGFNRWREMILYLSF
jgi:hypothetical protein